MSSLAPSLVAVVVVQPMLGTILRFYLYYFSVESSVEKKKKKILVPFIGSVCLLLLPTASTFRVYSVARFSPLSFSWNGFLISNKCFVTANFRKAVAQRTTKSKQLLTCAFKSGDEGDKDLFALLGQSKVEYGAETCLFLCIHYRRHPQAPSLLNVYTHFFTFAFKRGEADEA